MSTQNELYCLSDTTAKSRETFTAQWAHRVLTSPVYIRLIRRVVVEVRAGRLLLFVLDGLELINARAVRGWVPAERDVQHLEEEVHARQHRLGRR